MIMNNPIIVPIVIMIRAGFRPYRSACHPQYKHPGIWPRLYKDIK